MSSIAAIIAAAAALLAVIGGFIQFVLRGALLPRIEFDVEFSPLNHPALDQPVGEILFRIRNEGPALGYITDLRYRIRYRLSGESGEVRGEPYLAHTLQPDGESGYLQGGAERSFIQPGVTRWYSKPVVFPVDTCLISVWARFEYLTSLGRIIGFLMKFLLREGRVSFSVRRTFIMGDEAKQQA
jgi:hypothetical protein